MRHIPVPPPFSWLFTHIFKPNFPPASTLCLLKTVQIRKQCKESKQCFLDNCLNICEWASYAEKRGVFQHYKRHVLRTRTLHTVARCCCCSSAGDEAAWELRATCGGGAAVDSLHWISIGFFTIEALVASPSLRISSRAAAVALFLDRAGCCLRCAAGIIDCLNETTSRLGFFRRYSSAVCSQQ